MGEAKGAGVQVIVGILLGIWRTMDLLLGTWMARLNILRMFIKCSLRVNIKLWVVVDAIRGCRKVTAADEPSDYAEVRDNQHALSPVTDHPRIPFGTLCNSK